MRFIVELRLNPDTKLTVADAYKAWKPTKNPGVTLRGTRIGTRPNVMFVVGESENEDRVIEAFKPWNAYGVFQIYSMAEAGVY